MRPPHPRLLPITIIALAGLLIVKLVLLFQWVTTDAPRQAGGVMTQAWAAAADAEREPPPKPSKGEKSELAKAEQPQPVPEPKPDAPPTVSDSEKALLQELRQRRKELDSRADALAAREAVTAAASQRLEQRLGELKALQTKLEGIDAARRQAQDAGWRGLVKLYEDMKPSGAAAICNDLPMPVLVELISRMKDAKAAALMAAMNPDRARDVTSELAAKRPDPNPHNPGG